MAKMEKANAKMHILSHKLAVTLYGIWGRVKSQEGVREGNTHFMQSAEAKTCATSSLSKD